MAAQRYLFVDGLRGLAALAVLLFHLARDFFGLPILEYGALGVVVFFVLSGFVICHSFANKRVTVSYAGRFMLRRSIRLDPTYWFCIALAILVVWLPSVILSYSVQLPSLGSIGLHAFYLQGLTDTPQINIVFWSLCYEIQFYLVLCLLLIAVEKISHVFKGQTYTNLMLYLLTPCLMFSLLWPLNLAEHLGWLGQVNGLFVDLWYMFLLGVFSYLAISDMVARRIYFFALLCFVGVLFNEPSFDHVISNLVVMIASLGLFVAGAFNKMGVWLKQRWVQFLGLISYSLYISHDIVGLYVRDTGLHLAAKYLGWQHQSFVVLWVLFSIAVCIAFALFLYRIIEKPSIDLARKVKLVG